MFTNIKIGDPVLCVKQITVATEPRMFLVRAIITDVTDTSFTHDKDDHVYQKTGGGRYNGITWGACQLYDIADDQSVEYTAAMVAKSQNIEIQHLYEKLGLKITNIDATDIDLYARNEIIITLEGIINRLHGAPNV